MDHHCAERLRLYSHMVDEHTQAGAQRASLLQEAAALADRLVALDAEDAGLAQRIRDIETRIESAEKEHRGKYRRRDTGGWSFAPDTGSFEPHTPLRDLAAAQGISLCRACPSRKANWLTVEIRNAYRRAGRGEEN